MPVIYKPINITNTAFKSISTSSFYGGAIISVAPLNIMYSSFADCRSTSGGGFYASNNIHLHCVIFIKCASTENGGAFVLRSQSYSKAEVNLSLVEDCSSNYFGGLYVSTMEAVKFVGLNITKSYAVECVGGFEANSADAEVKYSSFIGVFARVHNGCAVFRKQRVLSVKKCAFIKCSHHSSERGAAAAILIDSAMPAHVIEECTFYMCDHGRSFTVALETISSLTIRRCCFSGNVGDEIGSKAKRMELVENRFDADCFGLISGFATLYHPTMTQNINTCDVGWIDYAICFFGSAIISLFFAFLHQKFNALYDRYHKRYQQLL